MPYTEMKAGSIVLGIYVCPRYEVDYSYKGIEDYIIRFVWLDSDK